MTIALGQQAACQSRVPEISAFFGEGLCQVVPEPRALRYAVAMTKPELEPSVLRANAEFYRAFSESDYAAMERLWAESAPVSCLHPGSVALIGRSQVLEGWREL